MLELTHKLERFYGPLPLPPDDPFALYVWEVLGARTTAARRDAAMTALRRIPALTPDALGALPRAKLETAVGLAGPYRDERIRALASGVDVFKRNRDFPQRLRGDVDSARAALALLPHLASTSAQYLMLFAGGHTVLPEDPDMRRVLGRLRREPEAVAEELGIVLSAMQRATLYLSHHGRTTCVEAVPLCHICPLRFQCPFPQASHRAPDVLQRGES